MLTTFKETLVKCWMTLLNFGRWVVAIVNTTMLLQQLHNPRAQLVPLASSEAKDLSALRVQLPLILFAARWHSQNRDWLDSRKFNRPQVQPSEAETAPVPETVSTTLHAIWSTSTRPQASQLQMLKAKFHAGSPCSLLEVALALRI